MINLLTDSLITWLMPSCMDQSIDLSLWNWLIVICAVPDLAQINMSSPSLQATELFINARNWSIKNVKSLSPELVNFWIYSIVIDACIVHCDLKDTVCSFLLIIQRTNLFSVLPECNGNWIFLIHVTQNKSGLA